MNWRLTAILALVLALLGGYYAYFEMNVFPRQEKAKEEAKKIFALTADDIQTITLQRQDTEILCERDNGAWKMLKPVQSGGDKAALEKISSILAEARYEKKLEDETSDWKPFGLDPPAVQLSVTAKDGTESQKLALGGKSPTNKYTYARLGQENHVLLLPVRLMKELDKSVFDLRDKRLFDFTPEQVDGLEIASGPWRMVAHRVDKEKWAMVVPLDAPVQSKKINVLLQKLKGWRVKEFTSENADDLSPYGLDAPGYTIRVKTGTAAPQTLMLGKTDASKKGVFAQQKNTGTVVMLDAKILEDLPKDVVALRENNFITLERDKVEKILLSYPHGRILLAKIGEDHWVMEEPAHVRADQYKVSNLLLDVDDMEITQFIDSDQLPPSETGLDSPAVRAEFWISGEKDPIGVELGRKTADGTGVYARQVRKQRVDVVDVKNLAMLSKTAFDLRFKRLLEFSNRDVETIHMTLAGKEIEIGRDGDRWKMIRPEKKELNSGQIFSFLWALNELEFKEVVSEDGKNVPSGAFETTPLNVGLVLKNGSSPGTLVLGGEVPEKTGLLYCRVEGRPLVAAVEPGLVQMAEKALEKAR